MNAMLRTTRALAVALAAALALAGCGGIPTSGPVIAGPAVDEVDPEYIVTPNGPAADADPIAILGGFMQAVRAPQSDYAVARQFLTPDMALAWDPNAGVLIRSGPAILSSSEGAPEDRPVIEYSFTTPAMVDTSGRYRASTMAANRMIEFSFEQVDGQWRISSAPNGIVLLDTAFVQVFAAYALYFFDPSGRYLVPDLRWFPARQSTPGLVVSALLAGPDDWLKHAVVTDFPTGTTLGTRPVVVAGGRASIDLSAEVVSASPAELGRMRQQLVATLDVADATITADGVPLAIESSGQAAVIDPQPSGSLLLGTATEFGHAGPDGIVTIPGISAAVVGDGARAVSLNQGQTAASYLAGDGSVRRVAGDAVTIVDSRPGLVAPSVDEYGWTWSAGAGAPLDAFDPGGTAAGISQAALPPDASIVSLAVSRDSTRLAVGLTSPAGPRLLVFGIIRSEGVPTGLDPSLELPAPGAIASVAWVNDRSLVVVADSAGVRTARVVGIGGPGESLGVLPAGAVAVGGRGGVSGVRALAEGIVLAPGGNDGWSEAGFTALYLGVQQ